MSSIINAELVGARLCKLGRAACAMGRKHCAVQVTIAVFKPATALPQILQS